MLDINQTLELLHTTRRNFTDILEAHSLEAINKVPDGFNNNIIWNFGHVIASQQRLCYKLSGLEMYMKEELAAKYVKGTKPEGFITHTEVNELKLLAEELPQKMLADFEEGKFTNFKEYPTSYGYILHNIEEAVTFNNIHEALHLGYAMALVKAL